MKSSLCELVAGLFVRCMFFCKFSRIVFQEFVGIDEVIRYSKSSRSYRS